MATKSERLIRSVTPKAQRNAPRSHSPGEARDYDDYNDVTWRFRRTGRNGWQWEKIDIREGLNRGSPTVFSSYEACVADAASAGYEPLMRTSHLVSLTLSQNPQPIPALLAFDTPDEGVTAKARSPVLKKRVAHPAIERIFGKGRAPAATRKRGSPSRAALSAAAKQARLGPRLPGKTKISRA